MTLSQWLMPWEFSITFMVVFFLSAGAYLRSAVVHVDPGRRIRHADDRPRPMQQLCFWSGMLLVYGVTQTGFDFYAEHEFFIHRLQHLVQHHVGPFLIVLGIPRAHYRRASSWLDQWRARAGRFMAAVFALLRLACHPVTSAVLFNLVVLFWLIPTVHLAGMLDWRAFRLMNFGMLVNGLLFWAAVLRGVAPFQWAQTDISALSRVILMVAVVPVQIMIGAVVFMTPTDLYPVYAMCGRAFGGITALLDQQIGGLILWVPGAMMSVAGILLVLRDRLTGSGLAPA
ncbi:MAG: cytochrome c oxidase assembly protein [Burkholderiaceae bacterium]